MGFDPFLLFLFGLGLKDVEFPVLLGVLRLTVLVFAAILGVLLPVRFAFFLGKENLAVLLSWAETGFAARRLRGLLLWLLAGTITVRRVVI